MTAPHARGTLSTVHNNVVLCRFIPACAGNAVAASLLCLSFPVHPRMRGERNALRPVTALDLGSSPHARGTLFKASP